MKLRVFIVTVIFVLMSLNSVLSSSVFCLKPSTVDLILVLRPRLDPEIAIVHARYIDQFACKWSIDRKEVVSITYHESEFNPCAISVKGAKGVMQVMVSAHMDKLEARGIVESDIFLLKYNYDIGCEILHDAHKKNQLLEDVLIAYVGGRNVEYVENVRASLRRLDEICPDYRYF